MVFSSTPITLALLRLLICGCAALISAAILHTAATPVCGLLAALALPVALGGAVEHQPHVHDCPA